MHAVHSQLTEVEQNGRLWKSSEHLSTTYACPAELKSHSTAPLAGNGALSFTNKVLKVSKFIWMASDFGMSATQPILGSL